MNACQNVVIFIRFKVTFDKKSIPIRNKACLELNKSKIKMKKTIIGIILFLIQISLAIFYNKTIDLIVVSGIATVTFVYILYNYFNKKYV